jgi:hypothetical protein
MEIEKYDSAKLEIGDILIFPEIKNGDEYITPHKYMRGMFVWQGEDKPMHELLEVEYEIIPYSKYFNKS